MIVGTTKINYGVLKKFVGRPQEIVAYSDSLVPIWARHIPHILDNQRYYLAIHLRNLISVPYKPRMELVSVLTDKITIAGVLTNFTSITELLKACDKDILAKLLEVEIRKNEGK